MARPHDMFTVCIILVVRVLCWCNVVYSTRALIIIFLNPTKCHGSGRTYYNIILHLNSKCTTRTRSEVQSNPIKSDKLVPDFTIWRHVYVCAFVVHVTIKSNSMFHIVRRRLSSKILQYVGVCKLEAHARIHIAARS